MSEFTDYVAFVPGMSPQTAPFRAALDKRLKLSSSVTAHEKAIVEDALRATGGRVFGPSGAAARLGIPRSTLESKIRALKINNR